MIMMTTEQGTAKAVPGEPVFQAGDGGVRAARGYATCFPEAAAP
jgi:hypothetical protein